MLPISLTVGSISVFTFIVFRSCHVFFWVATYILVHLAGRISSRLPKWIPEMVGRLLSSLPLQGCIWMIDASEGKAEAENVSRS